MHEIGIAGSILDAVRAEAARHLNARPIRAGVRIGELSGVNPEALQFCFKTLVNDTDLQHLELNIEVCTRRHYCSVCQTEFSVLGYDFCCPTCGRESAKFISGDQLEFAYLEVEEHEPTTA